MPSTRSQADENFNSSAATHFAHHESLHVIHDLLSLKSGEINSHDMLELSEIRSDVEQQPQGLVDCLEVLVQQRLSRYLPLNLSVCLALPPGSLCSSS